MKKKKLTIPEVVRMIREGETVPASEWCKRLQKKTGFNKEDKARANSWNTCYVGEKVISDIDIISRLLRNIHSKQSSVNLRFYGPWSESFPAFSEMENLGRDFSHAISANCHSRANEIAEEILKLRPEFYREVVPYLYWCPLLLIHPEDLEMGYNAMERGGDVIEYRLTT